MILLSKCKDVKFPKWKDLSSEMEINANPLLSLILFILGLGSGFLGPAWVKKFEGYWGIIAICLFAFLIFLVFMLRKANKDFLSNQEMTLCNLQVLGEDTRVSVSGQKIILDKIHQIIENTSDLNEIRAHWQKEMDPSGCQFEENLWVSDKGNNETLNKIIGDHDVNADFNTLRRTLALDPYSIRLKARLATYLEHYGEAIVYWKSLQDNNNTILSNLYITADDLIINMHISKCIEQMNKTIDLNWFYEIRNFELQLDGQTLEAYCYFLDKFTNNSAANNISHEAEIQFWQSIISSRAYGGGSITSVRNYDKLSHQKFEIVFAYCRLAIIDFNKRDEKRPLNYFMKAQSAVDIIYITYPNIYFYFAKRVMNFIKIHLENHKLISQILHETIDLSKLKLCAFDTDEIFADYCRAQISCKQDSLELFRYNNGEQFKSILNSIKNHSTITELRTYSKTQLDTISRLEYDKWLIFEFEFEEEHGLSESESLWRQSLKNQWEQWRVEQNLADTQYER